jgi:hypothetical protein
MRATRPTLLTTKARGCQANAKVWSDDLQDTDEGSGQSRGDGRARAEEYARIAFADIAQAYDGYANLLPVSKMLEDIRRSLAGVEVSEIFGEDSVIGQLKKMSFAQKAPALDPLAKHLCMFRDGGNGRSGLAILSRT